MAVFEQILQLPYAYFWLPGLVFVLVAAALYWITRPAPAIADVPGQAPDVQPVTATKPKNQRNMHRRQGNPVEVYVALSAEKKEEPHVGSVLDRSVGGMRLAMYGELAVGAVVSVRPVNADVMVPWVELEIRSCRRSTEMPDQFELGCQYVKSPPYSIQLLFG